MNWNKGDDNRGADGLLNTNSINIYWVTHQVGGMGLHSTEMKQTEMSLQIPSCTAGEQAGMCTGDPKDSPP